MRQRADVVVVGAGHNGLVAALMLARRGLDVLVLEEKEVAGGAARTERPFRRVPGLSTSTGAYLLGLMPPELLRKLDLQMPLLRRDPHYFLPTTGKKYLLFGSDAAAMKEQFLAFFSEQDWRANEELQREIAQLREDVAPTWLEEALSIAAVEAGATIETGRAVQAIAPAPLAVHLRGGGEVRARAVVVNADPFRLRDLIGRENLPGAWNARVDGYRRDGTTFKVNLALVDLPRFTCLPEDRGQFASTMHLLPDEPEVMGAMREAFADVKAGRLPRFPTIEWYVHTTVDPSLRDAAGHHNSALFVQWVPYQLKGTTWEAEQERYVRHLLGICDRFAPGTSALVADTFPLTPPEIERHFGITRGHIHHVDNSFRFADLLPYATPIDGVYSCSAGCHPAGSVIGAAGHNAAERVLRELAA